jgi:hypothetical protein
MRAKATDKTSWHSTEQQRLVTTAGLAPRARRDSLTQSFEQSNAVTNFRANECHSTGAQCTIHSHMAMSMRQPLRGTQYRGPIAVRVMSASAQGHGAVALLTVASIRVCKSTILSSFSSIICSISSSSRSFLLFTSLVAGRSGVCGAKLKPGGAEMGSKVLLVGGRCCGDTLCDSALRLDSLPGVGTSCVPMTHLAPTLVALGVAMSWSAGIRSTLSRSTTSADSRPPPTDNRASAVLQSIAE